eukprot:310937-Pleurochrysis_carterae.AAC.4
MRLTLPPFLSTDAQDDAHAACACCSAQTAGSGRRSHAPTAGRGRATKAPRLVIVATLSVAVCAASARKPQLLGWLRGPVC